MILPRIEKRLTFDQVDLFFEEEFGREILERAKSKERTDQIVGIRDVMVYFLFAYLWWGKNKVGRYLNRDHSTICTAVQRITRREKERKTNAHAYMSFLVESAQRRGFIRVEHGVERIQMERGAKRKLNTKRTRRKWNS